MTVEYNIVGIVILVLFNYTWSNEFCEKETNCSEQTSIYDKEYSKYLSSYYSAIDIFKNKSMTSCFDEAITEDLNVFRKGISRKMIELSANRGVKYQLIGHRLYRSPQCSFPSRCSGIEYFINKLRMQLPDFECIVNIHDWPQVNKHHGTLLPVFSFSKSDDYHDILYPAWSFWEGGPAISLYPRGIGRWDLHRKKQLLAAKNWPWEKKKKLAFFRGSRTSSERDTLILLSRKNPNLVNATYTKNQAWKSEKDTLGAPPADEVPLEEHCQYRYLFNFRGVAASFRFKYLFLCNSLVLHVGEEWKEFYYKSLIPWFHYIPIKSDATENEYRHLLNFIRNEDKIAKQIADQGYDFIKQHLKMEHVFCYWKNILIRYSELLEFIPKLDESLIEVTA